MHHWADRVDLGVRAETIAEFGLTSEQVAIEMALGALKCGSANLAVSNTGVAAVQRRKSVSCAICADYAAGFPPTPV
ncbi:MAG TPA: CinA family protein [Burkholderiaceae bacterium]|nr:CinA family protein [Burkholderiaceae bacterium]